MDAEWDWKNRRKRTLEIKKLNLKKKEGNKNELWRIWWTICATRINGKIK